MTDVTTMKAERQSLNFQLTQFKAYLDKIEEPVNVRALQKRRDDIRPINDRFIQVTYHIAELDKKGKEEPESKCELFNELYYDLLERADDILSTAKSAAEPSTPSAAKHPAGPSLENIVNTGDPSGGIKMPTLSIPTFQGSFENWLNFKSSYVSMVHENISLSKLQKHRYLISALEGDALKQLTGIETTADNYDEAWQTITDRYDNKVKNVQSHIKAFLDVKGITTESGTGLRKLVDTFQIHVRTLKAMQLPTSEWDALLVVILTSKLDPNTLKEWDREVDKNELPSFNKLIKFITKKCESLENHDNNRRTNGNYTVQINSCVVCQGEHNIYNCQRFIKLTPGERYERVKQLKLCANCLKAGNHTSFNCRSRGCRQCNKKHNSLLHKGQISENATGSTLVAHSLASVNEILLSTAIVNIYDSRGKVQQCRALLDCGSQSNFITQNLCYKLGLKQTNTSIKVCGINATNSLANKSAKINIGAKFHNFKRELNVIVLPRISGNLPKVTYNKCLFDIPKNVKLADPEFNVSRPIDLLLGADVFWSALCVGQLRLGKNLPILQKTHFGWIMGGGATTANEATCNLASIESPFDLQNFWQIENVAIQNTRPLSILDQKCEQHFSETFKRDATGRFIVSLPFIENKELGDSRSATLKRFYNLERKLSTNSELRSEYSKFMEEYIAPGHMEEEVQNYDSQPHFYVPHHAVIKESSLTTRLRVVFDASANTTNGKSLNDVLYKGPVLQDDLCTILLRFRMHQYVLTADVTKMYRQVQVCEKSRDFQKIFWRMDKSEPLKVFKLNTVTYGTAPAAFLAVRCMQELANINAPNYPSASRAIKNDFYMDDLLTGSNDLQELIKLQVEISLILKAGQFHLNKFNSNHENVLGRIREDTGIICLDKELSATILGLQWESRADLFSFNVKKSNHERVTKRAILSDIARLFDPLGLVNPIIVTAKILMQDLWRLQLDWDESVPTSIEYRWTTFRCELERVNQLKVHRFVGIAESITDFQLHGFSDASNKAYGACIYARFASGGNVQVNLLCAKSRVAPVKVVSLPRLELCGALLLAQCMQNVTQSLQGVERKYTKIFYWCDSMVTLSWITSETVKYKTFVANRVAEIRNLTNTSCWNYVNTKENPADLLSRGIMPASIIGNKLWWFGPRFLSERNVKHSEFTPLLEVPEVQIITQANSATTEALDIFLKYATFSKLIRVTAYCIRFVDNLRRGHNKNSGSLSVAELHEATRRLIMLTQSEAFQPELKSLKKNQLIARNSRVIALNPFLDSNGIIRVGGRLTNSNLSYDVKHPILLPNKHPFTRLLITYYHVNHLHAGVQTTLAAIRARYWPLAARNCIRQIISKCVVCFKVNPTLTQPLMGNLPSTRTQLEKPFGDTGVDYCGPFFITEGLRGFRGSERYT